MTKKILLKLVFSVVLMIVGSHAMDVPKNEGGSFSGDSENSVDCERDIQAKIMITAKFDQRWIGLFNCFISNDVENLSFSDLESLIAPNSILPNDIKSMALPKFPDATEEEMRDVIKYIYKNRDTFNIEAVPVIIGQEAIETKNPNRRVFDLMSAFLDNKVHRWPLAELKSLVAQNSILPETIKATAKQTLPDVTEGEIRRVIKAIHLDMSKPCVMPSRRPVPKKAEEFVDDCKCRLF